MSLNTMSKALISSLEEATALANDLVATAKMEGLPVPIAELGIEMQSIMANYELSPELLATQAGVSKNSVYKAMRDPINMRLETLESIINPLGLSICFAKRQLECLADQPVP